MYILKLLKKKNTQAKILIEPIKIFCYFLFLYLLYSLVLNAKYVQIYIYIYIIL